MAVKPLKTIQFPNSADIYEVTDDVARTGLAGKANKDIIYSYTITPEMFAGSAFPYTCAVEHELGGEPSSAPLIGLDISSYTTLEAIEAVESSYGVLYRVTFDSTTMTLYAKEIPETGFTLTVKVAM